MFRKFLATFGLTAMLFAIVFSPANATVSFDPASGMGFVGKGDVQLALGLNNAQLQAQADGLTFMYQSVSVSETTWTCDKDAGPQTQERSRTATTTASGVVTKVDRVKNQINGFILNGFKSSASESKTDGPAVGTCATGWTAIDLVVGEPEVVSGGLYVNGVPLQ